ncbi:arsenic metallochaperone ArsD family protein [Paraburkholderia aromaticivorans]|uniref:arsenic metallochaperone ArsD family protein n=1 Tax=Paraburkholderia aromaticivorans TaxID=2026199 RepID=UPI001FCA140C|nr:arsenic metallochaperone ArsD family protein [Paraburkholderia aromaticivorans]
MLRDRCLRRRRGPDPCSVQFSADVRRLAEHGVEVVRHGLGHDAAAFAANPEVVRELHAGMDRLPIATVDGRIISVGVYPSRAQLIQKLGLKISAADKPHIKAGACGCKPGEC